MTVKIAMVGTGYVGLVTGACFAELGHDVICVDNDHAKIARLLAGEMPIYEPGLEQLVRRNVERSRLRFSVDLEGSVRGREAVFLAVGTPPLLGSNKADLRFVEAAAAQVASAIDRDAALVVKSTVPVGTNRNIGERVRSLVKSGVRMFIVSNPEFMREGAAIGDFMEPDRIVIGADDDAGVAVMRRIYEPLMAQEVPLLLTSTETAEMIKYTANAFLSIKVSFINEIADLCERVGATVSDVAKGVGLDSRIGSAFLNSGPGWGGSCFPKDTRALIETARQAGVGASIVEAAVTANERRKKWMAERVVARFGGDLSGVRIAVLGLTFKGQTDDMRESPAVDIVNHLEARGAKIAAFDPSNPREARYLLPSIELAASAEKAAAGASALVVLTDWRVFKALDLAALASSMRKSIMFDFRNVFDEARALNAGFMHYEGIGRAAGQPRPAP